MKTKVVLAAAVLLLAGSMQAVHGSSDGRAFAMGELHWTRVSVCEHPWYPGLFLQYHVSDGCGNELFLHGNLKLHMVGQSIWAEGVFLRNGGCQILDLTVFRLCPSPEPSD